MELGLVSDRSVSTPSARDASTPRFKIGDRVRVDTGWEREVIVVVTISDVRANHGAQGAHRYWGNADNGGGHGFYEDQIRGLDGAAPPEPTEMSLDEYQEKSTGGLSLDEAERRYKNRPW
jgi:hypothetical protein